jgi:hypothetical protein
MTQTAPQQTVERHSVAFEKLEVLLPALQAEIVALWYQLLVLRGSSRGRKLCLAEYPGDEWVAHRLVEAFPWDVRPAICSGIGMGGME